VSFTRKTAALNIRSIASSSKQMKSGSEHSDLCILSQYIDLTSPDNNIDFPIGNRLFVRGVT
jgi:hypothetical protein